MTARLREEHRRERARDDMRAIDYADTRERQSGHANAFIFVETRCTLCIGSSSIGVCPRRLHHGCPYGDFVAKKFRGFIRHGAHGLGTHAHQALFYVRRDMLNL